MINKTKNIHKDEREILFLKMHVAFITRSVYEWNFLYYTIVAILTAHV